MIVNFPGFPKEIFFPGLSGPLATSRSVDHLPWVSSSEMPLNVYPEAITASFLVSQ